MLWVLTGATTVVLLFIGLMIKEISREPTAARDAALSTPARSSLGAGVPVPGRTKRAVPAASASPSPSPSPSPSVRMVTDSQSGLSYPMLGSPWRHGCPSDLQTSLFSWSAGENVVAGQVLIGGSLIDWHASACSGQLQQQFAYQGPADLQTTATSMVSALDPAYYAGIQHQLSVQDSYAMQVSGHQAWVVRFAVDYFDGGSQGLAWTSEPGALVVIDRGPDQVPSVFYVSVPGNLDTSAVSTLLGSLRVDH
jgi:hypothetical protein